MGYRIQLAATDDSLLLQQGVSSPNFTMCKIHWRDKISIYESFRYRKCPKHTMTTDHAQLYADCHLQMQSALWNVNDTKNKTCHRASFTLRSVSTYLSDWIVSQPVAKLNEKIHKHFTETIVERGVRRQGRQTRNNKSKSRRWITSGAHVPHRLGCLSIFRVPQTRMQNSFGYF